MQDKRMKRLFADCIWKPVFSTIMTATLSLAFSSGTLGSLVIAGVLGAACGVSIYWSVKKYLTHR